MSLVAESAAVPPSADREPRTVTSSPVRGVNSVSFYDRGDFAAIDAARAWLKERGFSYGPMQDNAPIAVMHGKWKIGKWKTLSPEDLNDIHARIMPAAMTASMRGGPVTIRLRSTVHSDVRTAFDSDPDDVAAQAHVEGRS